jgi:CHASE2 domain-containing sensor protein
MVRLFTGRGDEHGGVDGMDGLTAFGLASVGAMLACYALEERSPYFVLGFALACWAAAVYGWLSGAWPFTVVEGIWGLVALRRFAARRGRVAASGGGHAEPEARLPR